INSAVTNAKAFLKVQNEFGSFNRYVWSFVNGTPLDGKRRSMKEIPPRTEISDAMSKDLARRGFKFVGSTICYALLSAGGLDHGQRGGGWGSVSCSCVSVGSVRGPFSFARPAIQFGHAKPE